jgi:hypothetical protein
VTASLTHQPGGTTGTNAFFAVASSFAAVASTALGF